MMGARGLELVSNSYSYQLSAISFLLVAYPLLLVADQRKFVASGLKLDACILCLPSSLQN